MIAAPVVERYADELRRRAVCFRLVQAATTLTQGGIDVLGDIERQHYERVRLPAATLELPEGD